MERITVDQTLADQFNALGTSEICDPSGKVIGTFRPASSIQVPFTDEEIERRRKQPGRPLADILRDLENRA